MAEIRETDVKNSRGEIVISPGLKVRHKDSQYEYTVDGVIEDEKGDIQIVLNMPDEPRFDEVPNSEEIIQAKPSSDSKIIYEIDPNSFYYEPEEDEDTGLMMVSQKEFEKEYEVK